jgi:hypothetical protein
LDNLQNLHFEREAKMIKFVYILFAIAFAQHSDRMDDKHMDGKWVKSMGKCEDECVTFVTCLYDSKNNYTEGQNPVKARDLTWDCLWSIDDSWVIEGNLMGATKCTIKVYEGAPQSDVEDCYANDVYGPVIGMAVGHLVVSIVMGLGGILFLVAICCAHFRCYKPTMLQGTSFCCCKFFCPLAAVISVDRYQDSTAIAAVFSWVGCIYTLCCWKPKGEQLPVNDNYNNFQQPHNNGNVNWGV